ncbi:MAG TPA: alpha/beta hydrolase [Caulobacteraceae bacterium]|nr:alpha/beta hydrolase [Caulobacteraceae bacterium]
MPLRTAWDVALLNGALKLSQALPSPNFRRAGLDVEDRRVEALGHSVDVRILRPAGACRGVYLDIHGGAWVLGNARMDDALNVEIARTCGVAVVSVDYRVMLDQAVMAALDDCEAAVAWVLETMEAEFGADVLLMGGESAGAHLVASTLIRLRARGVDLSRVAGAVMFYGCYDLCGTPSLCAAGADTLVLHGPTLASALEKLMPHLTPEERRDPAISPLYADLRGLPPALFLVGERDPLLDDTELLAARWRDLNRNAEVMVAPEAPHAFNRLPTRMARKTNAYVRGWLFSRLIAHGRRAEPQAEPTVRAAAG